MTDRSIDECGNWINRGHPSYVWRSGQERRLSLVRRYVSLENKRILDVGCGVGMYVRRFSDFSGSVFGVDIEQERIARAKDCSAGVAVSRAEELPFSDNSFDIVFSHEVIEHVDDDRAAIAEAARVVKPGGHIVVYAPNRLYLFETHGIYVGKRYVFRLVPFVNYLPDVLRSRFCPHVRAYTSGAIRRLFRGVPGRFVAHEYVYPGFDNVAARHKVLAKGLRGALYCAERTPLRQFGLSHFIVFRKSVS